MKDLRHRERGDKCSWAIDIYLVATVWDRLDRLLRGPILGVNLGLLKGEGVGLTGCKLFFRLQG